VSRIIATGRQARGPVSWAFLAFFVLFNVAMAAVLAVAALAPLPEALVHHPIFAALTIFARIALGLVVLVVWTWGAVILGLLTQLTRSGKIVFHEIPAIRTD